MGTKTNSSSTLSPPSPPLSPPRPEVTVTPLLPRPLPSRTSKKPLPLESSRDSMTDNHSLRSLERRRPSKVCSHRSTIWREDSVSCSLSSQFLRTPSRPSKRSLTSEEWVRNETLPAQAESICLGDSSFRFKIRGLILTRLKKIIYGNIIRQTNVIIRIEIAVCKLCIQ